MNLPLLRKFVKYDDASEAMWERADEEHETIEIALKPDAWPAHLPDGAKGGHTPLKVTPLKVGITGPAANTRARGRRRPAVLRTGRS